MTEDVQPREFLSAHVETALDVASKVFTWGDLSYGDCHQTNGRIVLSDDGTGTWNCTTWTDETHSGDIWHCRFEFQDQFGNQIFGVRADSPEMDDGEGGPSPHYDWGIQFPTDPGEVSRVERAVQFYSC
ncbi:DUF6294 family protein [Streptomyces sp. NPDC050095]|uniref:DUF6294 family protein n=1 Tax=unclassified Streptomyces TaxID=2593676 RepID=UPI00342BC94F